MESQHRETEFARRAPHQNPMDGFNPMDCGSENPMSDDPFSLSALLSLDNYPELSSPSASGQVFSPFGYSSSPCSNQAFQQISSSWASAEIDTMDGISPAQRSGTLLNSSRTNTPADVSDKNAGIIVPKPVSGVSLAERMLRALSLFKESSGSGILAQVWMPIKHDNGFHLSTSEQPFLLDQILSGYREVSRWFTFSAEEAPGSFPGLPGRVFMSGLPEWTSNVGYYNKFEYLRAEYAHNHEVRGSLAVPIFDPKEGSCCAVLELVTTKEKPDFDSEMDSVCNALQAVELKTVKGPVCQPKIVLQVLTKNQKSAFSEILDVLRACCHAHMLPLALTWIPFSCDVDVVSDNTREAAQDLHSSVLKKGLLRVEDSACYVNDMRMKGFLHACDKHYLEKGQGIAGKALQSNHPFFSPDVKGYNIREYPLAHHARKYGLHAAVAIRLRSTFTGNDDYVLEFFLPVNCRGSSEQQELLNNLSTTMQRICRSLRTVSDAEVGAADSGDTDMDAEGRARSSSPEISVRQDSDNDVSTDIPFEDPNARSGELGDAYQEQFSSDSTRQPEKKRSTAEKNISLGVLQQYFSGSLKDAAKNIGVCPTTLKRICRQHGISRWPSRKINKVNRSLKKIQNVINSVQGVEGSLKYDPATGCLVAAVSAEKPTMMTIETAADRDVDPSASTPEIEVERFVRKLDLDDSPIGTQKMETSTFPNANNPNTPCTKQATITQQAEIDGPSVWSLDPKDARSKPYFAKKRSCKSGLSLETFEKSSDSVPTCDTNGNANAKADADVLKEHSHHMSSSMTDSSSGSASSCPTFKKSSKDKTSVADTDNSTAITVKATYKDDTVRFKFMPSMGCHQLLDEIGKRYRLVTGTFQLKYMDDEEEWVMLSSDSDLVECIEVLGSVGSRNLKLLVRDLPCSFGSSGGSNFLQS